MTSTSTSIDTDGHAPSSSVQHANSGVHTNERTIDSIEENRIKKVINENDLRYDGTDEIYREQLKQSTTSIGTLLDTSTATATATANTNHDQNDDQSNATSSRKNSEEDFVEEALKEVKQDITDNIIAKYTYATDFWSATLKDAKEISEEISSNLDKIYCSLSLEKIHSLKQMFCANINRFKDLVNKIPFLPNEIKTSLRVKALHAESIICEIIDNMDQVRTITHDEEEIAFLGTTNARHVQVSNPGNVHDNCTGKAIAAANDSLAENAAYTASYEHNDVVVYSISDIRSTKPTSMDSVAHIKTCTTNDTTNEDESCKNVELCLMSAIQVSDSKPNQDLMESNDVAIVQELLKGLDVKDEKLLEAMRKVMRVKDEELQELREAMRVKDEELCAERKAKRVKVEELQEAMRVKDEELRAERVIQSTSTVIRGAGKTLNEHLTNVHSNVVTITQTLNEVSGLNQAERTIGSTCTRLTLSAGTNPPIDENVDPDDIIPGKSIPNGNYLRLKENVEKDFDFGLFEHEQCDELKELNCAFQSFIEKDSTRIVSKKIKINNTIAELESILLFPDVKKTTWKLTRKRTFYPGTMANEKDGFQPIFHLILRAVANCLPATIPSIPDPTSSPTKNRSRREVIIPATTVRCRRYVDFVIEDEGRFYVYLQDYAMQLVCEGKPGCRRGKKPFALLDEARDQALSHVAKYVTSGLNFAGIGTNTHGTCIVATLAVVQVLQLELSGVGTTDAKLQLKQSRMLPLMTEKNYKKWTNDTEYKEEFIELGTLLYPASDAVEPGIPLGLLCLFNLMKKRRADLFGPKDVFNGEDVGALIGRGSFSDTYAYKENHVIKISRVGVSKSLKIEYDILSSLKSDIESENITCLPIVHEYFPKFPTSLGELSVKLPALVISPRGMVSTKALHCGQFKDNGDKVLFQIKEDISAALNFIHLKEIFHLDVAPKNVVVVMLLRNNQVIQHAMLIDFSVAWSKKATTQKICGFVGTPSYSHQDIFYHYPKTFWVPCAKHDFVGLGYTLATLANNGKLPFPPFSGFPTSLGKNKEKKKKLKSLCEERDTACCDAIDRSGLVREENKKAFKKLITDN
jgi:hypothetical protein